MNGALDIINKNKLETDCLGTIYPYVRARIRYQKVDAVQCLKTKEEVPICACENPVSKSRRSPIPVLKGFTVGLIDLQGNWIAKNSKYDYGTGD